MSIMGGKSLIKKHRFFYGWYIVVAAWLMILLRAPVAVSIFFKPMLEDFGWDRATLSSVQSVALIVFTISSPFLGRLIDRFGPKAMILVAVFTQTLSRVLNGIAFNIWHLYLARLLYNVDVLQSSQVLINRWFIKQRGTAQGIFATGVSLGTMILTPISQQLILTMGWRLTMLFWAAVTIAVMLPLSFVITDNPGDKGYEPYGQNPCGVEPNDPIYKNRNSALEAQLTVRKSSRFSEVIRDRSFWFLYASHLICGIGCGFMMTHIVVFATDMGYSEMLAAFLVSLQGAANLVGILITGPLSDKIVRKNVLALTHFVRSISFISIVVFIALGGGSLWLLYLAIVLFGFGWFTTAPLAAGLIADLFGHLRMGTLIGGIGSCHMFGMAVGAYLGGAIFELTQSYYSFFIIQGLLEFVAATFAYSIKQEIAMLNDRTMSM